ncbi:hypothetical protein IWX90DRAFT_107842 [Phyllosticta citrichinensis]|uniref:Uncharacterized protein n=1 Tax=Phyllosticta citrichinensis TaxID=1130410 RepID=A0ABR1Y2G1_9PEZI
MWLASFLVLNSTVRTVRTRQLARGARSPFPGSCPETRARARVSVRVRVPLKPKRNRRGGERWQGYGDGLGVLPPTPDLQSHLAMSATRRSSGTPNIAGWIPFPLSVQVIAQNGCRSRAWMLDARPKKGARPFPPYRIRHVPQGLCLFAVELSQMAHVPTARLGLQNVSSNGPDCSLQTDLVVVSPS